MQTFRTAAARTLSYQVAGDGPLVVMLPGGPGLDPGACFAASKLPGFRQLLFCPRGTGESDPPETPDGYRIEGYVSDLEELRTHLNVPLLTLYGNSHGASIALAYAEAYPGRVGRMVLANGPARMDAEFSADVAVARERFVAAMPDGEERLADAEAAGQLMRTTQDGNVRRQAFRTMMSRYVARLDDRGTAFLNQLCAAPMNFAAPGPMAAEMISGLDLLSAAKSVTVQTLVIAGELDVTVPAEHMEKIAEAMPNARFLSFDGVGHFVEVEAYDRWVEVVVNFLRS